MPKIKIVINFEPCLRKRDQSFADIFRVLHRLRHWLQEPLQNDLPLTCHRGLHDRRSETRSVVHLFRDSSTARYGFEFKVRQSMPITGYDISFESFFIIIDNFNAFNFIYISIHIIKDSVINCILFKDKKIYELNHYYEGKYHRVIAFTGGSLWKRI